MTSNLVEICALLLAGICIGLSLAVLIVIIMK